MIARRRMLAGLAALSGLVLFRPADAALQPADQAEIAEIEHYLDSIRTMSAEFQQFDEQGRVATGRIYLARVRARQTRARQSRAGKEHGLQVHAARAGASGDQESRGPGGSIDTQPGPGRTNRRGEPGHQALSPRSH